VKYRYCCQILMKLEHSRQIFAGYSNLKFHDTPLSGSRVVPCGRTDRQTDRHDAFRNFASATKTQQYTGAHFIKITVFRDKISSTLLVMVRTSFVSLVYIFQARRNRISEDSSLHGHQLENITPYITSSHYSSTLCRRLHTKTNNIQSGILTPSESNPCLQTTPLCQKMGVDPTRR
jgi:hypothetical protein